MLCLPLGLVSAPTLSLVLPPVGGHTCTGQHLARSNSLVFAQTLPSLFMKENLETAGGAVIKFASFQLFMQVNRVSLIAKKKRKRRRQRGGSGEKKASAAKADRRRAEAVITALCT